MSDVKREIEMLDEVAHVVGVRVTETEDWEGHDEPFVFTTYTTARWIPQRGDDELRNAGHWSVGEEGSCQHFSVYPSEYDVLIALLERMKEAHPSV